MEIDFNFWAQIAIIVTGIAGIGGLFLAIYNLYLYQRDKKPRIKVNLSHSFVSDSTEISPPLLTVSARNVGYVPVRLAAVGIWLPNKTILQLSLPDDYTFKNLPYTLLPGHNFDRMRTMEKVKMSLKKEGFNGKIKLYGYFRDEINNDFYSKKPFIIDLNEKI